MSEEITTVECKSLKEAIDHVAMLEDVAKKAVGEYHEGVRQLTGIVPGQQMTPMDIVKIWHKLENPKE